MFFTRYNKCCIHLKKILHLSPAKKKILHVKIFFLVDSDTLNHHDILKKKKIITMGVQVGRFPPHSPTDA